MLSSPNFKVKSNINTVWQRITSIENNTLDIGMRPTEMFMKFNGVEFFTFDGTTTTLNGISKTYESGLTELTDYVYLGGALTRPTSITSDSTNTFTLGNSDGSTRSSRIHMSSGNTQIHAYQTATYTSPTAAMTVSNGSAVLSSTTGGDVRSIEFGDSAITVTDAASTKGMVYASDYSTNFTARSIPDFQAVQDEVASLETDLGR
jgi:hypothetical protein